MLTQRYPQSWKEMSLDFRLMMLYHGCMMAMFLFGIADSRQLSRINSQRWSFMRAHMPGSKLAALALIALGIAGGSPFAKAQAPLRLKAGTKISFELEQVAATLRGGDNLLVRIGNPVYVDQVIAIPVGTFVQGEI